MIDNRTVQCVGTFKEDNEPLKVDIRIRTEQDSATVYRISLNEAIELRRELTDFLAASNVPQGL